VQGVVASWYLADMTVCYDFVTLASPSVVAPLASLLPSAADSTTAVKTGVVAALLVELGVVSSPHCVAYLQGL
jgi:hypothetical protein